MKWTVIEEDIQCQVWASTCMGMQNTPTHHRSLFLQPICCMRALIPVSQGLEADLGTGLFNGAYLEEATVASHSSLRQWVGAQESKIQGPDARVLCDG